MKILLTSTSFMDTPGKHQDLLAETGVIIEKIRGPLKEAKLLEVIANYDALICGDDEITFNVLKLGKEGKLKIISKYGIGLDKINLEAAKQLDIPVTNTPGVNQVTVAEHVLALVFSFYRNLFYEFNQTKSGNWERITGHELYEKTIAILGLGKIGKELAKRMVALGLKVIVFDVFPDIEYIKKYNLHYSDSLVNAVKHADVISLHMPLNDETEGIISVEIFEQMKNKPLIINTARAGLVDKIALLDVLEKKEICGYLTDVMWDEPMNKDEELLKFDNVFITPHIGSRTFESVERQGSAAVRNLIMLKKKYVDK